MKTATGRLALKMYRDARGHLNLRKRNPARALAYVAGVVNTLLWLCNEEAQLISVRRSYDRAARKLARALDRAKSY